MKLLLLIAAFTALLALTYGHHGMRRRGGCGGCGSGYDDDDDDYVPECGRGSRRDGCGRYDSDAGQGKRRGQRGDAEDQDETIYRFQIGDNFGAYEYLDEEGYLKGFYVDLLTAVCKKAGKRCSYLLDSYENCWRTSGEREYPGVGLLDGWYDGCLGMLPSPDRLNTFNFTVAFTPNVQAALYWREKDDVGDRQNLTGRRIGFIEGWAVSQRCLKRQQNISGTENIVPVVFNTHDEMVSALLNKTLDAILSVDVFDTSKLGIVPEEPGFQCTLRGLSVMTSYYSDVIDWWNCAFTRLQRSGEFKELCAQSQKTHASRGTISCI